MLAVKIIILIFLYLCGGFCYTISEYLAEINCGDSEIEDDAVSIVFKVLFWWIIAIVEFIMERIE